MREVLSLSLSAQTVREVKSRAKKRGFASVSDYLRQLIKRDENLISAEELLSFAREAEEEYKTGRTIKANSLADLL